MHKFTSWKGQVAPLMRANIDTDQIIPKQFLTTVSRSGLGDYLFDSWRFADAGILGKKPADRIKKTDFILNQPQHAAASILLAGKNFGCGSSREHAVWSLFDYGIRVVIAPDFADIFYSNSIVNGLLPAIISEQQSQMLAQKVVEHPQVECRVDLAAQSIECDDISIKFNINASSKNRLLKGLDPIGITLEDADAIRTFEQRHLTKFPWLDNQIRG